MAKVRWGVLSTAKIGMEKVIPAMQNSENCAIQAIASRDLYLAKSAAKKLNIPRYYGSYQELIADPEIDAIYNPLPNHLHVPWSIKSILAGKHVLCEKPIALTATESEEFLKVCKANPKIKVMEAFMYRHHPQWQKAKRLVEDGEIGTLQSINSVFSYYNMDPSNVRNISDIGGGGLMDIGCYCISLARFLFSEEPERVCGTIDYDPEFKTDRLASVILQFSSGTSTFICATQMFPFQKVQIFGNKGRIEIEIPFNAPSDKPTRIIHQTNEDINKIRFEICNQYTIQGDLFSKSIQEDSPVPTTIDDAVANMRVMEAILKSNKEVTWAKIS